MFKRLFGRWRGMTPRMPDVDPAANIEEIFEKARNATVEPPPAEPGRHVVIVTGTDVDVSSMSGSWLDAAGTGACHGADDLTKREEEYRRSRLHRAERSQQRHLEGDTFPRSASGSGLHRSFGLDLRGTSVCAGRGMPECGRVDRRRRHGSPSSGGLDSGGVQCDAASRDLRARSGELLSSQSY